MKMLALLTFCCACTLTLPLALGAETRGLPASQVDTGNRPIGVDAKEWIPVSDKLGFVIVRTVEFPVSKVPQIQSGTALLAPTPATPKPAAGYFMIKTTDGWRRIVVMTPADILAAKN